MTSFLIWWHRVILRHEQAEVMNGETEPGVWCLCEGTESFFGVYARWFPSDGGHGR